MTFCAELRLDGQPATTALAERMLLASAAPPAGEARARAVGPLAIAVAAPPGEAAELTHTAGLLAVVDGWSPPDDGAGGWPVSRRLAADWRRFGAFGLDRMLGDWAVLLFEEATGRLVLARSPRSMRTLVVRPSANQLLVATGLAQLRAAGVPLEADRAVLAELLTHGPTTEHETLVRGVERVPGGHLVEIRARPGERPSRRAFSSLYSIVPPLAPVPVAAAAEPVRQALWAAVADASRAVGAAAQPVDAAEKADVTEPGGTRAAGRGDAPAVAVGLSGGVDSSTVTGIAAALAGRPGAAAGRLVPISMVFPGEPHDESRWIDAMEEHTGVPVLRVKPGPYDWDTWRAWSAATCELPPWPGLALADAVREAARGEGARVLLSGEGGDDWLRGWRHHWPDLARAGRLWTLRRQMGPLGGPRGVLAKARAVAAADVWPPLLVPPWIRERELRPLHLLDRLAVARAVDDAAFASADHRGRWAPAAYRATLPMTDTAWTFYATAGLDWRHPLHDRRVIEAALTTPGATLYQRGLAKPVLRAAAGDVLPRLVRDRPGGVHFLRSLADAVEAAGGPRTLLAGGPLEGAGWLDVDAAVTAWETALAEPHAGKADSRGPATGVRGLMSLWPVIAADTWLADSGVRL